MHEADSDLMTTAAVAKATDRSIATVNRWAAQGKLHPAVEFPGRTGARLYRRADVEAFLAAERTEAAS